MNKLYYDLHIHSCLSPCGNDDMLPSNIVGMSSIKGLNIIALTDHNSCKNCYAAMKIGQNYNITVIPGMELATAEEVHVICLFKNIHNAMEFDKYVYDRLPDVKNQENIFGNQQIVDENDNITATVPKLLINATSITFDSLDELIPQFNGIFIPAHIDKNSYSLISNLGFFPPESKFKAAEVVHPETVKLLSETNPYLKKCKIISDSDAHYLQDINEAKNFIYTDDNTINSIFKALNTKFSDDQYG